MLDKRNFDFQEAIYLTENCYHQEQQDENEFNSVIKAYVSICRELSQSGNVEYTKRIKKDIVLNQCAVFFMTDTVSMQKETEIIKHPPFSYNHTDFAGQQDCSICSFQH